MGAEKPFDKEMAVVGVLSSAPALEDEAVLALESLLGPAILRTEPEDFLWTDYYVREMGNGIRRFYLAFGGLLDPSGLAGLKIATDRLESRFAEGASRRFNFDPGLLAPGRFVLATTKDRAHRIALSGGIYAELTLIFESGSFRALPWTYPDWGSEPCRSMLADLRRELLERLRI